MSSLKFKFRGKYLNKYAEALSSSGIEVLTLQAFALGLLIAVENCAL